MQATVITEGKTSTDFNVNKKTTIWVDSVRDIDSKEYANSIRILFMYEPPGITYSPSNLVLQKANKFHHIFTYYKELLSLKNAIFTLPLIGDVWVRNNPTDNKIYKISFVCGDKEMTNGHLFRKQIWHEQKKISIPKTFYKSGCAVSLRDVDNNPVLNKQISSKQLLFDTFMFHLCIENLKMDNWITEKLGDCLVTKTVPVYWGCPNIGNFFNIKGMIILETNDPNEVIKTINKLTPDDYTSRLQYVEENYQKICKYISNPESITYTLKKHKLIL